MIDYSSLFPYPDAEPTVRAIDLQATPIEAAARLQQEDHFVFLDSSQSRGKQGRYSVLAWNPGVVFESKDDRIRLRIKGQWQSFRGNPLEILDGIFRHFSTSSLSLGACSFAGGAVGYFGYDLFPWIEQYDRLGAADDLDLPDCCLGFYDAALLYDHESGRWSMAGTPVFTGSGPFSDRLDGLARHVTKAPAFPQPSFRWKAAPALRSQAAAPVSNFTKEQYLDAVGKAIEYIYAGDLYQINLSQRFHEKLTASPFDLFRALRNINPSYYGAYLAYEGRFVISSSPELFLRKAGLDVETRPIKGTRPRGKTPEEDETYRAELDESPKDRAELSMIVDLERNDLGRVCEYGSVVVDEHRYVETLPTVFHTISTVRGRIRAGVGAMDLLRATFPGGSITGCPKIRSIGIIDELEPTKRNVYTGSVGYVGFTGDLELNIAIRTLIIKGDDVYYQVGGGIVADSDPEAEYRETLDKALAMQQALRAVESVDG